MYVESNYGYYLDCWDRVKEFLDKDWKKVLKEFIEKGMDESLWEEINDNLYKDEKTLKQLWKEKRFDDVGEYIFYIYEFDGFIEYVVDWMNKGEMKEWVFKDSDYDHYDIEKIKVGVHTEQELAEIISAYIKAGNKLDFNKLRAKVLKNII